MLSRNQLRNVCLQGHGHEACRYLARDDVDYSICLCSKLRPKEKKDIDDHISRLIAEAKSNGHSISLIQSCGNNCAGYPVLKHIEQGYDKD